MMKIYLKLLAITFVALLLFKPVFSQKNQVAEQQTVKFINYYNAGKTDSLYTLLSDDVKVKVPETALAPIIQQFKGGLGNLTHSEYIGSQQEIESYIAIFERSGQVLLINFNKSNLIVGFFVVPDPREGPGSITLNTGNATLKGTLSVPQVTIPIPVVLLVAGSGPTDRDGNSQLVSGKSNYLLQISDSLKLKNVAVLRYDKRGVGQSTSTKAIADFTIEDMVDDAAGLVKMLKADKRFSKVIVAGHSEGSLIGMLACTREQADAFISLSGPGVAADVMLRAQLKSNLSNADYEKGVLIVDSIKTGNFTKQKMYAGFNVLFNPIVQPYLHSWMKYDPSEVLSKLTIPVLIIQGTNDIQVSVNDSQVLKKAQPKAELKTITGMSHILKAGSADRIQNAATYTMPELPLHPELIPTLYKFINGL